MFAPLGVCDEHHDKDARSASGSGQHVDLTLLRPSRAQLVATERIGHR